MKKSEGIWSRNAKSIKEDRQADVVQWWHVSFSALVAKRTDLSTKKKKIHSLPHLLLLIQTNKVWKRWMNNTLLTCLLRMSYLSKVTTVPHIFYRSRKIVNMETFRLECDLNPKIMFLPRSRKFLLSITLYLSKRRKKNSIINIMKKNIKSQIRTLASDPINKSRKSRKSRNQGLSKLWKTSD